MYTVYIPVPWIHMGLCRWLSIISGYRNHRSDIWRPTAGNEKVASHSLQSSYLGLQRACFSGLVPPFYGRWVRQQVSIYSDKFWGGFKIEDIFVLRRIFAHFRVLSEALLKTAGLEFPPHFEYTSGEAFCPVYTGIPSLLDCRNYLSLWVPRKTCKTWNHRISLCLHARHTCHNCTICVFSYTLNHILTEYSESV